jgi:hypothetical protein
MDLYGQKIASPETIETEQIEVVIVAIPVYYSQIEGQIKANHKGVKRVIDLSQLADPSFQ